MTTPTPCPICHEPGGFHNPVVHRRRQIPRHLLKEKGWQEPDADAR